MTARWSSGTAALASSSARSPVIVKYCHKHYTDNIFQLEDSRGNGATHLKILAGRVVVARLDGHLDWLDIVTSGGDLGGSAARARVRLISTDSSDSLPGYGDQVRSYNLQGHMGLQ